MVNTDKRQRHKEGHRSRVEEARLAAIRRRRKRRLATGAALLVVLAALGTFVALRVGDDDQEVVAGSTTSGSGPASTLPALRTPPGGKTVTGDTPCPTADSPRTTKFEKAPPRCIDPTKPYSAEIVTSEGTMAVSLDAEAAPVAVNNFVVLARYHFFEDVPFHRIIPGFVAQTGSTGRPDFDTGSAGYTIPAEKPAGPYEVGSLAMAKGPKGISGSQFFFITGPQGAALPGEYPRFGKVTEGLEVLGRIAKAGTASEVGEPTKVITIERVTITGP